MQALGREKKSPVHEIANVPSPSAEDAAENTELFDRKEVEFRPLGKEDGYVWGDLLCSEGIYLPCVGEDDYRISFDGRWITTHPLRTSPARLVDRKTRRSWILSDAELLRLNAEHWKLPRWNGEVGAGSSDANQSVHGDLAFDEWLKEAVALPGKTLVAALDLWVPPDCMPDTSSLQPPALPEAPRNAAVKLSLQRFLPPSLRPLRNPMNALQHPVWQLHCNAEPQLWLVDASLQLVWRPDGQALAFYGYPLDGAEDAQLTLAMWSVAREWLTWPEHKPEDRKPWVVVPDLPDPSVAPEQERASAPGLRWEGEVLLQRMVLDTPEVDRLHDGRKLLNTLKPTEGCASFMRDGRVLPRPQPRTKFFWERHLKESQAWTAHSVMVAGDTVKWTLAEPASEVLGATAAYQVQWGSLQLPGTWELEHAVVQGRWIVLIPSGAVPRHGGVRYVQVWDGEQLQRVELPAAVVRVRPVPSGRGKPRAQVLLLVGVVEDRMINPDSASWRWSRQEPSPGPLGQIENSPVYEWRDIALDVHGFWRMQPRWREVSQVQHPCADGDYVWRFAPGGDELWWFGGVHQKANNEWNPRLPRFDGVCVTSGGAVLCGVSPCALPQPEGQGWVILEMQAQSQGGQHWMLHWLRPDAREVRSLPLQAHLPLLLAWDGQGVHWRDAGPDANGAVSGESTAAPRQLIVSSEWAHASVEKLQEETPEGLWMRKQDSRYVGVISRRHDMPWQR